MSELSTEVMIVGAGPTGLMLACDLRRRGIPFHIVDRSDAPPKSSRGLALQALSLEAFDDLGLVEELLEKGVVVSGVRHYNEGRLHHSFELPARARDDAAYPYMLMVEQQVTESILLAELRRGGVVVQRGTELKALLDEPDQVQCWLRGPEGELHVRSSYLVGCDGAHSSVRRLSRIGVAGGTSELCYHVADVELDWSLPRNEIVWLVDHGLELVVMPLAGERRYRLNLWRSEPTAWASAGFGSTQLAMSFSQWREIVERLAPCDVTLLNPHGLMAYRTGYGLAESFLKGRSFLAGDAAHMVPQCMALGLNLGLHDAYNLGWKLALVVNGDAPPELLESYQRERKTVVEHSLMRVRCESSLMGRASHLEDRQSLDQWSQLDLTYRHCLGRFNSTEGATVQAGDRAPDGELKRGKQEPLDLYDLLDGLRHHLLVFAERPDAALDRWVSTLHEMRYPSLEIHRLESLENGLPRAYGAAHGDLVLIRPDRFIAARGSLRDSAGLESYLAEHLSPRAAMPVGENREQQRTSG